MGWMFCGTLTNILTATKEYMHFHILRLPGGRKREKRKSNWFEKVYNSGGILKWSWNLFLEAKSGWFFLFYGCNQ